MHRGGDTVRFIALICLTMFLVGCEVAYDLDDRTRKYRHDAEDYIQEWKDTADEIDPFKIDEEEEDD